MAIIRTGLLFSLYVLHDLLDLSELEVLYHSLILVYLKGCGMHVR